MRPFSFEAFALLQQERCEFNLLTLDQVESPAGAIINLTQHLANNHLDVLIVDLHTLEAINLLDLVDDVLGKLFNTFEAKNIVGTHGPSETTSPFSALAPLQRRQHDATWESSLVVIGTIGQQLPSVGVITKRRLPLVSLPKATVPDISAKNGRLFGLTRFEQVGNTRKTTGNVTSLGTFLRNTGNNSADPM